MRRFLMVIALATLLPGAALAQPPGQPWTSQGAELLTSGWAVEPMIGFPEAGVRFHVPVGRIEIVPKAALFYGEDLALLVGNDLGVQVKIPVFQKDIWTVSVNPGMDVLLGYWGGYGGHYRGRFGGASVTRFSFGLRVDPEAVATVRPLEWLAVYFGMHLPVTFWSYPDFVARIPILFKGGVEFTIAHKINLWVTPIDLGPSIYASRLYSGAWLSASFMLGAAFPF